MSSQLGITGIVTPQPVQCQGQEDRGGQEEGQGEHARDQGYPSVLCWLVGLRLVVVGGWEQGEQPGSCSLVTSQGAVTSVSWSDGVTAPLSTT